MTKTCLITGGTGFIGHHVAEYLLIKTDWNLIIVDRLDETSTLHRLADALNNIDNWHRRIAFIYHNLRSPFPDYLYRKLLGKNINYVLHLAASSHVDRSITEPLEFIYDNVVGTHNLLWLCRELEDSLEKIIYFSTDEVFGSAKNGENFKEWDRYNSSNPYAATKAGAEEIALAYANTYALPITITHTMNVFGERQHREKFIPLCIKRILAGQEIKVHGNKDKSKAGSRFYIYAKNVAQALLYLLIHGQVGDKYNIVGEKEIDNLSLCNMIGELLKKKPIAQIVDFHSSRPGHDLRYALDGGKLQELGFVYNQTFDNSLAQTVHHYIENPEWLS